MNLALLDRLFAGFVFTLGLFVCVSAWRYGLYRNDVPGPGFFPAIAGVMMIALAAGVLVRDLRGGPRLDGAVTLPVALAIAGVTAAIIAFVWVAPVVGMSLAAFVVMVAVGLLTQEPHQRGRGFLVRLVLAAAGTVVVCHVLFGRVIGIPLVEGPWGF